MSTAHGRLHLPGDTPVHRLPPHCKLVATVAFVLAVVSTPREQIWAFALFAVNLVMIAALARVPAGLIARRMMIEVPFVLFALLMPFVAQGERITVAGLGLSIGGLWAAWNVLVKGTLGVVASILLAATTEPRMLLLGAERLRLPPLLVQIATFMVRYADVVSDELHRMKIARASRGFEPRGIRHAGVLARSLAALFLRAYERGERVHLAMISRGYEGRMPVLREAGASGAQWAAAAAVPGAAVLVSTLAWVVR